jgi:hypothetical protein
MFIHMPDRPASNNGLLPTLSFSPNQDPPEYYNSDSQRRYYCEEYPPLIRHNESRLIVGVELSGEEAHAKNSLHTRV